MLTSRLVLAALLILPALSHAEDDPPFNTKNQLIIPFSGSFMYEDAGEMVNVSGDLSLKLMLSYRGGPVKVKSIIKLDNITATGATSGDPYKFKGQSKMLVFWPTTVSGIDIGTAMVGDPIPGIDVKMGRNPDPFGAVVHVDVDPMGQVTGSSATVQSYPAPNSAVTIPVLQITN
jgi:hypothetical protein